MAFLVHFTLVVVCFGLVACQAALTLEEYWNSVLPDTPMPEAIESVLKRGSEDLKTSENKAEGRSYIYGAAGDLKTPENKVERRSYIYAAEGDLKLSENKRDRRSYIYGAAGDLRRPETKPETLSYIYAAAGSLERAENKLETRSYIHAAAGDSETPENKPERQSYIYGAAGDLKTPENNPEIRSYMYASAGDLKTATRKSETHSFIYVAAGESKAAESKPETRSYIYGAAGNLKAAESKPERHSYIYSAAGDLKAAESKPEKRSYIYGAAGDLKAAERKPVMHTYIYAAAGDLKTPGVKNEPSSYIYAAAGDLKATENKPETRSYIYAAAGDLKTSDHKAERHSYIYAAAGKSIGNKQPGSLFFLEKDLYVNKEVCVDLKKSSYGSTFSPREVSDSMPFASSEVPTILNLLSLKPESKEAEQIKKTLERCEMPASTGEEKQCATSLESMIDFTVAVLGKKVQAVSTVINKTNKIQEFKIGKGLKKIGGDKAVVCHSEEYPYAVFFCHAIQNTRAYMIPLVTADGTESLAVAVCHVDTSAWNSRNIAFLELGVARGTVPVCHFLAEGHVVWVPK